MDVFDAAVDDGFARIKTLITKDNVNIHQRSMFKWTLLHCAITYNRLDIVVWLIDLKADVNVTDANLDTPLQFASRPGSSVIMQVLLDAGANAGQLNKLGRSSLHAASYGGYKACVQLLLNHYPEGVHIVDIHGDTALSRAVVRGDVDITRLLLDAKSNIEHRDGSGRTPLCHAFINRNDTMIEFLLDRGAQLDVVKAKSRQHNLEIYRIEWAEAFVVKRNRCRKAARAILTLYRRPKCIYGNGKDVLVLIARFLWRTRKNDNWTPKNR